MVTDGKDNRNGENGDDEENDDGERVTMQTTTMAMTLTCFLCGDLPSQSDWVGVRVGFIICLFVFMLIMAIFLSFHFNFLF